MIKQNAMTSFLICISSPFAPVDYKDNHETAFLCANYKTGNKKCLLMKKILKTETEKLLLQTDNPAIYIVLDRWKLFSMTVQQCRINRRTGNEEQEKSSWKQHASCPSYV